MNNPFYEAKAHRLLKKTLALADEMAAMTDEELTGQTDRLKALYREGKSLDKLLPEAFATIREAARRVLGLYAYEVQILGGIALHFGRIAEMKTGEGKTLVAIMPLYLNALTEKSCILVTMNSYLACRDCAQMGQVFRFLGLSCTAGVREDEERIENEEKKEIYASDIVYTTHGVLGFDYLLDNLQGSSRDRYLRDYYYVIIDEVDSVLLDSAQTPLVISGAPRVQSNLYDVADFFVSTLQKDEDYEQSEDGAWLTDEGIAKAEDFFSIERLFDEENFEVVRHILLALRAHALFKRDKQYVVDRGEVKLLDQKSGRVVENTHLQAGQHQALEAKEHVKLELEKRAMASITFQDFFNLFPKIAGMSGTAIHDRREFKEVYGVNSVKIPTAKPVIRKDYKDIICPNLEVQLAEVLTQVEECHGRGQPVLLVMDSIAVTDIFSEILLEAGIPHNVLTAFSIAKEAEIIAEAGQLGAVTIATSVAGRGTDIKLGEGAAEAGGLAVLCVGLMANKRLEMQARGRSGRQGDPGFSRQYVSLEDDAVNTFGAEWLAKKRKKNHVLKSPRIRHAIHAAQKNSEEKARMNRKQVMSYGVCTRLQRNLVYGMRAELMSYDMTNETYLMSIEREVIREFLKGKKAVTADEMTRFILDNISYSMEEYPNPEGMTIKNVEADLMARARRQLAVQLGAIDREEVRRNFCRLMILKAVDESWIEQVDYMNQLRTTIEDRRYTQRNVLFQYSQEGYRAFEEMKKAVKRRMMRNILLGELARDKKGRMQVYLP